MFCCIGFQHIRLPKAVVLETVHPECSCTGIVQEEPAELPDAEALPVLAAAVLAGGGLARFLPLPPHTAAWLQRARACASAYRGANGAAAPAQSSGPASLAGGGSVSGQAEAPSGPGSSSALAEALEPGASGAPRAGVGQGEQGAAGRQVAAWPDLCDEALLAWPAGPLARHLAGARSRAQMQRIDWDAALRCASALSCLQAQPDALHHLAAHIVFHHLWQEIHLLIQAQIHW